MHRLNSAFNRFAQSYHSLSEADREIAIEIISRLAELIELPQSQIRTVDFPTELKSIQNYLDRKISRAKPPINSAPNLHNLLVGFRNELAHGPTSKRDSASNTKKFAPIFWKILEASDPRWNPHELMNILAYCMGTHYRPSINSNLDSKKIIRFYKAIFSTFDEDQKIEAFSELILRFRSEPAFKGTLESMVRR